MTFFNLNRSEKGIGKGLGNEVLTVLIRQHDAYFITRINA